MSEIEIKGTITLDDETSEFIISNNDNWYQWGASTKRLGKSVFIVERLHDELIKEYSHE